MEPINLAFLIVEQVNMGWIYTPASAAAQPLFTKTVLRKRKSIYSLIAANTSSTVAREIKLYSE